MLLDGAGVALGLLGALGILDDRIDQVRHDVSRWPTDRFSQPAAAERQSQQKKATKGHMPSWPDFGRSSAEGCKSFAVGVPPPRAGSYAGSIRLCSGRFKRKSCW